MKSQFHVSVYVGYNMKFNSEIFNLGDSNHLQKCTFANCHWEYFIRPDYSLLAFSRLCSLLLGELQKPL